MSQNGVAKLATVTPAFTYHIAFSAGKNILKMSQSLLLRSGPETFAVIEMNLVRSMQVRCCVT